MVSPSRLLVHSCLIIALLLPNVTFGGYIGEDLGTDLYKRVDSGQGAVTKSLIGKRITGSNARMNKAIKAGCFKGADIKPFLKPGQEFTQDEFALIEGGILDSVYTKINGADAPNWNGMTSDDVICVQNIIARDFEKIKMEVAREQSTLSRVGNTGIYTDGSLKNSSFDLMTDLEQIHDIIFSKEVPYEGTANLSAESVKNFLSNPSFAATAMAQGFTLTDRLSYDLADSGWKLAQMGPAVPNTTTPVIATSTGELCAIDENTIGGVDEALLNDLNSQARLGTNTNSQGGGEPNSPTTGGSNTGNLTSTGKTLTPPRPKTNYNKGFRCTGFFCIDVDFVMYSDTLLGGGKNYSIQTILEQNFKIVTSHAGASFIQAKHTNNFFQLLLKDLDLPSMAHIGVVVTSLPAPILNLPGDKTPRGKPSQTDAQKEFDAMVSGVFTDYGLSVRRSNSLSVIANNEKDYGISTLNALTTDFTQKKLQIAQNYRGSYATIKEAELKNELGDSFAGNLNQFEAFTKALVDHLGNFSSLIQKIDEIPSK
ncbi:MAG: hypothetical protein PHU93_00470 [Candidatus Gracilibacteria bacterium]|nr:hypothetical protein [Candidatus Gracilibacteria bacterium]